MLHVTGNFVYPNYVQFTSSKNKVNHSILQGAGAGTSKYK